MKRLVQLRIHLDARFKAQKYSVGNKKEKILLNVWKFSEKVSKELKKQNNIKEKTASWKEMPQNHAVKVRFSDLDLCFVFKLTLYQV